MEDIQEIQKQKLLQRIVEQFECICNQHEISYAVIASIILKGDSNYIESKMNGSSNLAIMLGDHGRQLENDSPDFFNMILQAYEEKSDEEIKQFDRHKDLKFVKATLPDSYKIRLKDDSIYCYSDTGIDEDSGEWEKVLGLVKLWFGIRFLEVYHQTSTNHKRFSIYFKQ